MTSTTQKQANCKPFLKWAGGKGQLIDEIDKRLPGGLRTGEIDTYVEPFVGGGAVFFYIASRFDTIKLSYLLDINEDLVNCYRSIKGNVEAVIAELEILQKAFFRKRSKDTQKKFYLSIRKEFNLEKSSHFGFATAAKLIFLNKTCYNGLYRVNRKGQFNVPFGRYENPTICNHVILRRGHEILQNVEIVCGDFEECDNYIDDHTFVYFDPPYRPLSTTASFTSYSKNSFSQDEQIRLAKFCRKVKTKGAKFLLSNSDPKNEDPSDDFFESHYRRFNIQRVKANRAINCKASRRGQISELLVTNYEEGY